MYQKYFYIFFIYNNIKSVTTTNKYPLIYLENSNSEIIFMLGP